MKNRKKIKNITLTALGTVLLAICSWISVGGVTLQTFAVFFLLSYFGSRRGMLTVVVYLLMGALGIPVFSGFGGGIGWLFGPTGGFLLGFVVVGVIHVVAELIFKEKASRLFVMIPVGILSVLSCYLCGACTMFSYYVQNGGSISFSGVFIAFIFNYGFFDTAKILLAHFLARYMRNIKPI